MSKTSIRPTLTFEKEAESEFEKFQNEVLRPILKLQNDLLFEVFKTYVSKRKSIFYKLSEKEQVVYIDQNVRKDMKFKHYLEGIITGMFTLEEYSKFMENEEELTKRMVNLLVQRLQSQFKTESK
ncbi:MAG: hypothetical protein RLZZ306_538 [Bacteroidota bacterium]|jgi:hypothetical protein